MFFILDGLVWLSCIGAQEHVFDTGRKRQSYDNQFRERKGRKGQYKIKIRFSAGDASLNQLNKQTYSPPITN